MKEFFLNIQPGTVLFKRYDLIRVLSARFQEAVYLCSDLQQHNKLVALKILLRSEEDRKSTRRFFNEYAISRVLKHPNLVTSSDFQRDESFLAFQLEYFRKGTLATIAKEQTNRCPRTITRYLLQLCSALQAMHSNQIFHRDIKLENIYMTDSGFLKLGDFGIAVCNGNEMLFEQNIIHGTPGYVAPEYITHGTYTELSEIFALGVIGYRLATGRFPFHGKAPLETLLNTAQQPPAWDHCFDPAIPQLLKEVILACLEKNPVHRPQSAEKLRESLLALASPEESLSAAAALFHEQQGSLQSFEGQTNFLIH
jgi:serine/threonine-protein kinase